MWESNFNILIYQYGFQMSCFKSSSLLFVIFRFRPYLLVPYLGIFIPPLSSLLWTFNNFKWLLVIGTTKDFTSDHFWTSGGHFKCVCSTLLLKRDWSPYLGTTNTFSSISPKAKNEFGWKFVRLFIRASRTKNV